MNNYKIGYYYDGSEAFVKDNGSNPHIFAVGCSGSGKTTALMQAILEKAKHGERVIVFHYKHCLRGLPEELDKEYHRHAEIVNVGTNGIMLPIFGLLHYVDGDQETERMMLDRVVAMLKNAVDLSPTQQTLVIEAIKACRNEGECDFDKIADYLKTKDTTLARNTIAKVRLFCDGRIKAGFDSWNTEKPILELNLNDMEEGDQERMANFMVDYLFRTAVMGAYLSEGITVYIDEAQTMDFSPGSPIFRMVNESRKHRVQLMLAAPQLLRGRKKNMDVLSQFGTCLFFKPLDSELQKTACIIESDKSKKWLAQLERLGRGQFIAKGNIEIMGVTRHKPVMLNSRYEPDVSSDDEGFITIPLVMPSEMKARSCSRHGPWLQPKEGKYVRRKE